MRLICSDLSQVDYPTALGWQDGLVAQRCDGEGDDVLLLLEHPPVITLGRGARGRNVLDSEGLPVYRVRRGGDVTFHGPGQLVGYPIIDLKRHGRDVHAYIRKLEQVLISVLASFAVVARRRDGLTGVWVKEAKIASIGIGVRRWITSHGFALNVNPDLAFFRRIVPCGLSGVRMTSMVECGAYGVRPESVRRAVAGQLAAALGYKELVWSMQA